MKLHAAMTLAERVQRELQPFCHKCEIAGSIRRARPEVGDIDLVILPKVEDGISTVRQIKDRCRERCRVITDGAQNFICGMKVKHEPPQVGTFEFQLDIFFAHGGVPDLLSPQPSNFGSLLLCRTGSKEHNIWLATRAKSMDMKWNPYQGLFAGGLWELEGQESVYRGGQLIASETEEQIYAALGLKWIAPALREQASLPFSVFSQEACGGSDNSGIPPVKSQPPRGDATAGARANLQEVSNVSQPINGVTP
jgi:DNA polymerase/3'-5' exonuclease PolX